MLAGNADLSSMLGWVSIACWIVVYSPQIYENYSLQSGEGLSVIFVLVWFLGDCCNFAGAILAQLLPTVIIIALYYTLCDCVLMTQIYYYRWKAQHRTPEETPLLRQNIPPPPQVSRVVVALRYLAALLFVSGTGIVAWWLTRNTEEAAPPAPPSPAKGWTIQILGWTSAVLYLGSRLPQILKNFQTRCEGLAPALFLFAIAGNVTYSLSILAKSTEREYLVTNASWLAGSALTVFFDITVLGQMWYYRSRQSTGTALTN
ncbi:PQ loop repeat-domain-containing protein [Mycena amicta]|nr:PQ loop repeat-domain-containing protein [Mycena amicta]